MATITYITDPHRILVMLTLLCGTAVG